MENPASLTGQYLAGKIEIVARAQPQAADAASGSPWRTRTAHNLRR